MNRIRNFSHLLWNQFTVPLTPLPDNQKQDAQLYARVFMVLGFICILVIALSIATRSWEGVLLTLPSLLANLLLYSLSRTRYYYFAPPAAMTIVLSINWIDMGLVSKGDGAWMLGVSIYIGSFFYKVRGLLIWSLIAVSGTVIIFLSQGLPPFNPSLILMLGFMGVVIINKATVQRRNALLKTSEARLRAAIDGSLDIFLLLELVSRTGEFQVTDANTAAAIMANKQSPQLLIGSNLNEKLAIAALPHETMLTHCHEAIHQQKNIHKEQELSNGRWIEYQIIPFDQNIALTIRDITRKKQAAVQDLQLAIEQHRVDILTNFITDASHEFRTPLTIIETSSYLLTKAQKPEHKQKYSKRISQQITRVVKLVDKLALVSQLETTRKLETQPVALRPILNNLALTNSQQLEENSLTLQVNYTTESPLYLPLHTEYFMIALQELLANSICHSPTGGTIQVKVNQNKRTASIIIEDTAPSIPPDVIPKLFDLFFREDQAHTTPGFGLGLPIARRVIELHEGAITIQPKQDVGNMVKINLPTALPTTVLSTDNGR